MLRSMRGYETRERPALWQRLWIQTRPGRTKVKKYAYSESKMTDYKNTKIKIDMNRYKT